MTEQDYQEMLEYYRRLASVAVRTESNGSTVVTYYVDGDGNPA